MMAMPVLPGRVMAPMPVLLDGLVVPVRLALYMAMLVNDRLVNLVAVHLNVLRHDLVVLDMVMLPVSAVTFAGCPRASTARTTTENGWPATTSTPPFTTTWSFVGWALTMSNGVLVAPVTACPPVVPDAASV